MRQTAALAFFLLVFGLTSCIDRHDRESEAIQNMAKTYDEALNIPLITHFQHGYESFLRAAMSALPSDEIPVVFEGVRKVVHFNDSPDSGLWYASDGEIKSAFYSDLEDEGFEMLAKLKRDDMDVSAYIKGDEHVNGTVIILETESTVQIFDLAGDINLEELVELLNKGNLDALDVVSGNFLDDIL